MLKVYLYAHFLGPYWIAPIHNFEFVARLRESQVDCEHLGTRSRMEGMLGKLKFTQIILVDCIEIVLLIMYLHFLDFFLCVRNY